MMKTEIYFSQRNTINKVTTATAYETLGNLLKNMGLKGSIFECAIVTEQGDECIINDGIKVIVYDSNPEMFIKTIKDVFDVEKMYVKRIVEEIESL